MTRKLQDLNEQLSQRGGSGADDKEFYDRKSADVLNSVLKEYDKKYGGKYGTEFNITGNGLINGVRQGVIANGLTKQKNFIAQGIEATTSKLNGQAFTSPEAIDEIVTDYTSTVGGIMADTGASQDTTTKAVFAGHRPLIDSAIEGHIQKGNYDQAVDLLINKYSHLYNTEDQNKALKNIRDRKLQAISTRRKEEDRIQKQLDANTKQTQVENAANAYSALAKTEDPKVIAKIKDEIIEMGKEGSVAYSAFGGLLNFADDRFKEIVTTSSYSISEKVYNAKTPADLDKVRESLNQLVHTKNIDAKTAERWERTIHQLKKTRIGKPLATAEAKIYFDKLQEFTKPMGMIEKMMDNINGQIALKKKVQTEAQYKFAVLNGTSPELAYAVAVRDNYPGFESIELFPGYNKVPKNSQEIHEFVQWGRTSLPDSKVPVFSSYLGELENALSREHTIQRLKSLSVEAAAEKNIQVIEDFLDLDELTKPRGNQLPLIFRR